MADLKISELPAATTPLDGTELMEVVQGGVNKKVAKSDVSTGGGGTWGSITGTLSSQTDLQSALDAKFTTESASETVQGIIEIATQAETNTGTDDVRAVTPLKAHVKNRKRATKTTAYTIAQSDDQGILFADSASAIAFEFPVLEAGTYVTIVNIDNGDVTWTATGTTFVGAATSIPGGVVASVTFYYNTTTEILVLSGTVANLTNLEVDGGISVKAGASVSNAKVGGIIHTRIDTVGNVGTGEDTIYSFSVPANTLNVDKSSISGFVCGTFAANANNKNVRVKYGATTLIATGAVAFNTGDWRITFEIVRTGATTQRAVAHFSSSNTSLSTTTDVTAPAETLSGAVTFLVTGEATSNDDITATLLRIRYDPNE